MLDELQETHNLPYYSDINTKTMSDIDNGAVSKSKFVRVNAIAYLPTRENVFLKTQNPPIILLLFFQVSEG